MRVLHLSDLHITPPNVDLRSVWLGPARSLHSSGTGFDVIVVSGDLSQQASPNEYADLAAFIRERLVPLLSPADPQVLPEQRIVLVPGNHDVDWSKPVWRHITKDDLRKEQFAAAFKLAARDGGISRYRVRHALGRSFLYEVDEGSYAQRFRNAADFVESFYRPLGSELTPTDSSRGSRFKRMDLQKPGEDWSARNGSAPSGRLSSTISVRSLDI